MTRQRAGGAGLGPILLVDDDETTRAMMRAWLEADGHSTIEFEEGGRVLAEFPPGERYYVAFDCDGVDPSVMPGTSAPLPGGLSYDEAAGLLTGLARRGTLAGINFAEHYPSLDVNGITALAIVRLIVQLIGTIEGTRP